jgi:hypothetical protein
MVTPDHRENPDRFPAKRCFSCSRQRGTCAVISALKTLPWLGTRRCSNSCAITKSWNRSKFQRVVPGVATSVIDATEKSWGGLVVFAMVPTLARASNLCPAITAGRRERIAGWLAPVHIAVRVDETHQHFDRRSSICAAKGTDIPPPARSLRTPRTADRGGTPFGVAGYSIGLS